PSAFTSTRFSHALRIPPRSSGAGSAESPRGRRHSRKSRAACAQPLAPSRDFPPSQTHNARAATFCFRPARRAPMAGSQDDTRRVSPMKTAAAGDSAEVDDIGELSPGSIVGEYAVVRFLSEGGCGTVYEAVHRVLRRRAALKVLHRALVSSPEVVERFVREAKVVNLIRHPNIVDIYEFGALPDRRPYFVMELLEGSNLTALVSRRGCLSPPEVLEILEPV